MATQLTDLEVHEVSLVDSPANKQARVILFKRDGLIGKALAAMGFGDKPSSVAEDLTKASAALEKGVGEVLSDESLDVTAKSAAVAELFADYTKHVDATIPEGVAKALAAAGLSAADEPNIEKGAVMAEDTAAAAEETVGKADAEAAPAAVETPALEKADATDAIAKALAEKDAAIAKVAELEAKVAKADEEIAKAAEAAALAEVTKRVAAFGGNVEIAKDLRTVERTAPEVAKRFEALLKAAAEQTRTAKLFAEFGTSQGGDATTPAARMNAAVAEMRKADPKLSEAQAISKIATSSEHRDVWNAYKQAGAQAA